MNLDSLAISKSAVAMTIFPLPEPFASIPRTSLLFGPSPIQSLDRISADLSSSGHKVHIFAKRDDCNSGLAYGGNKTRKLEYLLADALLQKADTLVSVGGIQSNHTRQVAAVAAKAGLKCTLLQLHWVPGDESSFYDKVGNIQLSRMMGAEIITGAPINTEKKHVALDGKHDNVFVHNDAAEQLTSIVEGLKQKGQRPYLIPAGA